MKTHFVLTLLLVLFFSGCATPKFHRGIVAMKISDSEAHVGLTSSEVKIGDHVELYTNNCSNFKIERKCEKVAKGYGVITEILNENYVVVKFDPGTKFKEGDFVEKKTN